MHLKVNVRVGVLNEKIINKEEIIEISYELNEFIGNYFGYYCDERFYDLIHNEEITDEFKNEVITVFNNEKEKEIQKFKEEYKEIADIGKPIIFDMFFFGPSDFMTEYRWNP